MTFGFSEYAHAPAKSRGAGDTLTMLVKLAPPILTDLLRHSAWFPALDRAALRRVTDDVREIEVPHAARHAARL